MCRTNRLAEHVPPTIKRASKPLTINHRYSVQELRVEKSFTIKRTEIMEKNPSTFLRELRGLFGKASERFSCAPLLSYEHSLRAIETSAP